MYVTLSYYGHFISIYLSHDKLKPEPMHTSVNQENLYCRTQVVQCDLRGWSLCEIIDQAGAGFPKPGQQQRLLFPVEAGQDDYIKEK